MSADRACVFLVPVSSDPAERLFCHEPVEGFFLDESGKLVYACRRHRDMARKAGRWDEVSGEEAAVMEVMSG